MRRARIRCAGHGPGQEPDCARRPLSGGAPTLRGRARRARNPRAVTDPHPAHTRDTYAVGRQFIKGRYPGPPQGNAGGTVERCDPPVSFAATWEFGGQVSWIEVALVAEPGGRTRLVLEHIALVDERWDEFGPGAVGVGWDMGLVGLAVHLSSGRPVGPGEGAAWAASADGRRFMSLSSQRWCDASIAAGTDEAGARAVAGRTIAAYTGTGS